MAAPPSIRNADIRGLEIGGITTIVFDGIDFPPNPRVMMAVPTASQAVRPGATATHAEIDVTLDDTVDPGFYNLYLAGENGISEKVVVALDRLPQRRFGPTVETLPVALHGTLSGSTTLRTSFHAKAGQRVICEIESQRLGGKLRPVLHLYDVHERHLAWSLPSPSLRGDTRLAVTAPADGQYTLTLNDLQYAAPAPAHFRLKIGDWQYADAVFPAAVERGKSTPLELIGNLPAGKVVTLTPAVEAGWLPAGLPGGVLASGPSPAVLVSDLPELLEQPAGDALQELPVIPVAINGRLAAAGEEDRYRFKAAADTKLRCEVFAARLGSPMDSIVEIRRPDGAVLAANDDVAGTTDSLLEFTVPKDAESLVVAVRDVQGRGGAAATYRLAITPVDAPPVEFQLSVERDGYNVVQSTRQVVRVRAIRQGYLGPIELAFGQLPWGVAIDSAEIPAGSSGKLITLIASADSPQCSLTCIRGRATTAAIRRTALTGTNPIAREQPWLAAELPVSLAAREGVGFDADWQPQADAKLVLGGKFSTPVRSVRPAGYDGPVRLTLLTSQNPPQVNGIDDPNRTLRPEPNAPVEIPSDGQAVAKWDAKLAADKALADAQAAQAAAAKVLADAQTSSGATLEAATKAKADADARVADAAQKKAAADEAVQAAAAAAKNDANFNLAVPADLPPGTIEIAFRAELLSRDRQRVLMTVCTPVHKLAVFNPLRLQYLGEPKFSVKLDRQAGATLKLAGKIERLEGLAGDVTVTIAGLPAGVNVPRLVVPAAQSDFELELKFPANAPLGTLQGLLIASGKMVPNAPLEVRSEPVAVGVELLPPEELEK